MIEAIMLVALGFLIATLLALAGVPALARRAERLARKRAEAAFPLSLAEIAADRDHLRAELALRMRTVEQSAQRALTAKAGAMREIGQRDMTIAQKAREVAQREETIADLERRVAALTDDREGLRTSLTEEMARSSEAAAGLDRKAAELAALEATLAEANAALAGQGSDLAAHIAELGRERMASAQTKAQLTERERDVAALREQADAVRVAQIESRTVIMALEGQRDDLAARLAAAEAARRSAVEALQTAGLAHAQEGETMQDDMRRRDGQIATLHAEVTMLQGALAEARSERLRQRQGEVAGLSEGNAALRQEIMRIAERLMSMPPHWEAAE